MVSKGVKYLVKEKPKAKEPEPERITCALRPTPDGPILEYFCECVDSAECDKGLKILRDLVADRRGVLVKGVEIKRAEGGEKDG